MFQGSITALVTPFTEVGEIDREALQRLVEFHLANGTDGLVIAGTTGESPTVRGSEFQALLKQVTASVAGRVPVIAGTGSASTAAAIEQTRIATETGVDGVLVVTPYYNRPMQAGLEAHFMAVADASPVPLLLYNVPSRTAVDLAPATVEALASHPRIAGIKEAVPDPARVAELCRRCGPEFTVLSGDDPSCLAAMRAGARGVISVAANVSPALMHELCSAALRGDWAESERIDEWLRPLFVTLALETNPIPVKWALFEMGLVSPQIRLPLTRLAEKHRDSLRKCLVGLGLIRN
jgi:4-hydroxy-tetrahydrodipicolinate synthase